MLPNRPTATRLPRPTVLVMTLILAAVPASRATAVLQAGPRQAFTSPAEAVTVGGQHLQANLNRPISNLGLFVVTPQGLKPVPFQVDERNHQGAWCLPRLSPLLDGEGRAQAGGEQDESPNILDADDELAFMPGDVGPQATPEMLPAHRLAVDEITVHEPATGTTGHAYLVSFSSPPARSPVSYVASHVPQGQGDAVRTPVYDIGYTRSNPIVPQVLTVGGRPNLVDRLTLRVHARLMDLIPVDRDETDVSSKVARFSEGPVRVIRETRSRVRLAGPIKSPAITNTSIHYRNTIILPFRMNIPFSPESVAQEAAFAGVADFKDLQGWRVRGNADDHWVDVDGKTDAVEAALNRDDTRWVVVKGKDQAVVMLHRGLPPQLKARLEYQDNPSGMHGNPSVGFSVTGGQHLLKGAFEVAVLVHLLDGPLTDEEALREARRLNGVLNIQTRALPGVP